MQQFTADSELSVFLASLGLSRYVPLFDADEVDMESLALLQPHDYEQMGVPRGPRLRIQAALGSVSGTRPSITSAPTPAPSPHPLYDRIIIQQQTERARADRQAQALLWLPLRAAASLLASAAIDADAGGGVGDALAGVARRSAATDAKLHHSESDEVLSSNNPEKKGRFSSRFSFQKTFQIATRY